jgi:hydroxypyruvate isomerase
MNRRQFLPAAAGAALLPSALSAAKLPAEGRLNQSLCRWCYAKTPIEELAKEAAALGIKAMDLVDPKEWDAVKNAGLQLTVVPGPTSIPNGLNRKEDHDAIEQRMRPLIEAAAKAKAKSIIVFSGNRKGMADDLGAENTIIGLNRLKKYAEETGVMIVMELLNSKVNHKDYMCDHTAWGAKVMKEVGSPMVKLLYDIYHMQIMEGDVIRNIRDNFAYIGHYHTGGNPGRNEIDDTQELNYPAIAKAVADLNFTGYFAHEFVPKRQWLASLTQACGLCAV